MAKSQTPMLRKQEEWQQVAHDWPNHGLIHPEIEVLGQVRDPRRGRLLFLFYDVDTTMLTVYHEKTADDIIVVHFVALMAALAEFMERMDYELETWYAIARNDPETTRGRR